MVRSFRQTSVAKATLFIGLCGTTGSRALPVRLGNPDCKVSATASKIKVNINVKGGGQEHPPHTNPVPFISKIDYLNWTLGKGSVTLTKLWSSPLETRREFGP